MVEKNKIVELAAIVLFPQFHLEPALVVAKRNDFNQLRMEIKRLSDANQTRVAEVVFEVRTRLRHLLDALYHVSIVDTVDIAHDKVKEWISFHDMTFEMAKQSIQIISKFFQETNSVIPGGEVGVAASFIMMTTYNDEVNLDKVQGLIKTAHDVIHKLKCGSMVFSLVKSHILHTKMELGKLTKQILSYQRKRPSQERGTTIWTSDASSDGTSRITEMSEWKVRMLAARISSLENRNVFNKVFKLLQNSQDVKERFDRELTWFEEPWRNEFGLSSNNLKEKAELLGGTLMAELLVLTQSAIYLIRRGIHGLFVTYVLGKLYRFESESRDKGLKTMKNILNSTCTILHSLEGLLVLFKNTRAWPNYLSGACSYATPHQEIYMANMSEVENVGWQWFEVKRRLIVELTISIEEMNNEFDNVGSEFLRQLYLQGNGSLGIKKVKREGAVIVEYFKEMSEEMSCERLSQILDDKVKCLNTRGLLGRLVFKIIELEGYIPFLV